MILGGPAARGAVKSSPRPPGETRLLLKAYPFGRSLGELGDCAYLHAMDTVLKDHDLQSGVRRALDRAARVGAAPGVRVVPMKNGYVLQSVSSRKSGANARLGYRRQGPARLGLMGHLGLKLDD